MSKSAEAKKPWLRATQFLVILPGTLAQAILTTSLTPGLPRMAQAFGHGAGGEFLASIALTSGALGLMLAGFGSGWLFDRVPARAFMVVFLILMAAAGSAGLLLDDPIAIVGSRVIAGVAACALATACMAFLNVQYSPALRPAIVGYQTAFGSGAAITALLIAGQLVNRYGWHASFALYLIFVPILALVPAMPQTRLKQLSDQPTSDRDQLRTLSLWPIYLLAIALFALVVIPGVQGPYLLQMNGVGSASTISAVVSLSPFIAALVSLGYGFFDRRLGAKRSLQLSLFSGAVGLTVLANAHGVFVASVGMACYGFGIGFWTPYLIETIMRKNAGSSAFGILLAALSLGIFLNPVAFAGFNAISGLRVSLIICAAGLAVGGIVSIVRSVRSQRPSIGSPQGSS